MSSQHTPNAHTPLSKSSTAEAAVLHLPEPPAEETGPVMAWEEDVTLRTWMPAQPDVNPLFLEKRVYQGSSGRVYPLPVIDRIETEPVERAWRAIHLQNEYIRLMVMPELGGRIHVGLDRINGYDFFYRQNVIKPALVGLAGPWISGGVEFNWPQHHRPATYMPVATTIERDEDGSITVWCSDHDPMARMKGMHGVCLRPGKAYVELRVRLYNRTEDTQTFLWWANVATRVHEHYQSFFPHDVAYAADHAKRAVTEFPLCKGHYYGVDYAGRAAQGVAEAEQPRQFRPDGSYAANDLSRYANIPVPTSYMIANSKQDFFGGYDHQLQAGVVHVANHHIAPGKKQWTWGNQEFGYAWDRNLTESDGPYIELMAGVYTDNQPDFSFLAPGETKSFTQHWYPIRAIGIPDFANLHAALRLHSGPTETTLHLQSTAAFPQCTVRLLEDGKERITWQLDLDPATPVHLCYPEALTHPEVRVEHNGKQLIGWAPHTVEMQGMPDVATEPPLPADVASNDELYLIGLHLEQYRHPTRTAESYWQEALKRDAGDSRAHLALGRWRLRRGEFALAEEHLRASIRRLTSRNPNPADGEPHYQLGLALRYQNQMEDAYAAFYKATWCAAWRGPAYHRLAEMEIARGDAQTAVDHLNRALSADADNLRARNLKALALRTLGRLQEAEQLLIETLALDPLDAMARYLLNDVLPEDAQLRLDLVFELLAAGACEAALPIASAACRYQRNGAETLLHYADSMILARLGLEEESRQRALAASMNSADYVFPSRLEELQMLQQAIERNPTDARAHSYLGNLLYDRRRHSEAIALWEQAVALDKHLATAWRNLGFAYFNIAGDAKRADEAFRQARTNAFDDARILYEHDQLRKRMGTAQSERLKDLERNRMLVHMRDDLSVELATLYNNQQQPNKAYELLCARTFQPWEGGEGLALAQFVRACILQGIRALRMEDAEIAYRYFAAALQPPANLAETHHPLANLSQIEYWMGVALTRLGQTKEAEAYWNRAAARVGDFQQMQVQTVSEMTYWSARALNQLGRNEQAQALYEQIANYAAHLSKTPASIDYFATSLPTLLLFDEDLQTRQTIQSLFLEAQACYGKGDRNGAAQLLGKVLALDNSHSGALDWTLLNAF